MRRFSSEGSLLDLDFFSWRKVAPKRPGCDTQKESGTYTPYVAEDEAEGRPAKQPPIIQEPSPCEPVKKPLMKEQSVSVENLRELGKQEKSYLEVCSISEGYRAYSDSQLAPAAKGSTESVDLPPLSPSSPSSSSNQFFKSQHRHQHRAKLSAAKLHFKSLFVQSPHSSNSNLAITEHKDSAKERRSRLQFMRQWSQVGLGKKRTLSRQELEKWAESLDSLLASQNGVSVFGAFLRTEFSEENLQFYLACEQYRRSSNNFSLQKRAKDICTTYIQPGSPREVNLDSKTRELTIQLLQAPSHKSLSHAQRRIYSLLDLDCYPRFLQSSIYLALLREAD
ncbi:regulator of G-protein signaling 8 [Dunckerocampus dactyliophorus]|uniref:regulator of G-protein signaling 8 n=1 Tax=Dunckerocampus dactyliophorus TaxID=161453 RepID=UPI002405A95F|nr:regulator of G-protein signaling 8 [Dunckerocampus dactyliophorus]XP_054620760.1 regulator of G-protein signaling 8 [Dunckerocampus dactyliophorus]